MLSSFTITTVGIAIGKCKFYFAPQEGLLIADLSTPELYPAENELFLS
jgi:hypothetical protein